MVAIAVFSIVMVTAMSALLSVIDANNKARAIKTAVNNISFALEGISKDMRVGKMYTCATDFDAMSHLDKNIGHDCNYGDIIRYRSIRADIDKTAPPTDPGRRKFVYYWFNEGQIWQCLEKDPSSIPGGYDCDSEAEFDPITSPDVQIATSSKFYILGVTNSLSTNPSVKTQPRMIVTINGEAGAKAKIRTKFDLQTSVNQINRE